MDQKREWTTKARKHQWLRRGKDKHFNDVPNIEMTQNPKKYSYDVIVEKQKKIEDERLARDGNVCGGCRDPECELESSGPVDSIKPSARS